MPSNAVVIAIMAAGVGAATYIDLRTRRVPNPLTLALALTGIVCAASGLSGLSIAGSLIGAVLGLVLMLPGHMIGGTGAGDVKLFAAAGALIGPIHIATAFFYTAVAGGVLALMVAIHRRRLRATLDGTARLVATHAANAADLESPSVNNRFAYAPAIAVGTMLAALGL